MLTTINKTKKINNKIEVYNSFGQLDLPPKLSGLAGLAACDLTWHSLSFNLVTAVNLQIFNLSA